MRVHSLTIVHYGKDYLSYALRSVYDQVEACHVFYTPTPSHGHQTNHAPRETKQEIVQAAYAYDPDDKVKWYDMQGLHHEGEQRDLALKTVVEAGADIVLVVDYDEVWSVQALARIFTDQFLSGPTFSKYLVNMTHFWRSFDWVCRDDGWPVRIIVPGNADGGDRYISEAESGPIYHFGYAITDSLMRYKWRIHGHKNELRGNWLENIWPDWPPISLYDFSCEKIIHNEKIRSELKSRGVLDKINTIDDFIKYDCYDFVLVAMAAGVDISTHPTNEKNFWIPEPFDKGQLPVFMREHPFYGLEKIE